MTWFVRNRSVEYIKRKLYVCIPVIGKMESVNLSCYLLGTYIPVTDLVSLFDVNVYNTFCYRI